jgi:glutathione synthase/RimK-type ligase-like ATP-grasp enzyme
VPRSEVLYREDSKQLRELPERLGFPLVLKIPDGSFSRGVVKVDNPEQLAAAAARLFQSTALLIAQEFLYTDFDWRIGVLNRKPLYACKYFMSRGHWQIYNHSARGSARSGGFECLKIEDAPADVVRLAVRGSAAIGNGLYGVDIKQTRERTVLIEVNDNPSIDAGVEDTELDDALYQHIMRELLRRMEAKRNGVTA